MIRFNDQQRKIVIEYAEDSIASAAQAAFLRRESVVQRVASTRGIEVEPPRNVYVLLERSRDLAGWVEGSQERALKVTGGRSSSATVRVRVLDSFDDLEVHWGDRFDFLQRMIEREFGRSDVLETVTESNVLNIVSDLLDHRTNEVRLSSESSPMRSWFTQ